MSDVKLLPCPFCGGGAAYMWDDGRAEKSTHKAACPDCGAEGPEKKREYAAAAAWNERAAPALTPKQEAAANEMAKALENLLTIVEVGIGTHLFELSGSLAAYPAEARDALTAYALAKAGRP